MPDLIITKYAIIPMDYNEETELDFVYLNDYSITNTLLFNKNEDTFRFNTFTIRVYFEWYEGIDESMDDQADTEIGTLAVNDNASFKMSANIKFEQFID